MKYEITKEQIKQLSSQDQIVEEYLEEWFPEAKLEIGNWYIGEEGALAFFNGYNKDCYGIHYTGGFHSNAKWFYGQNKDWENKLRPATESEVFEALKKEAVKIGFVDGVEYLSPTSNIHNIFRGKFEFDFNRDIIFSGGVAIFNKGKWAKIIKEKTLSKSEAEAKLNELINDGYDYKIA